MAPPNTPDDRIRRIRDQIAAGTYETPEKLEIAIETLLQREAPPEGPTGHDFPPRLSSTR